MAGKYVIGVDGGNTKTDYFLFDINGTFIDHIRAGTCSHEALPGSYEQTYKVMNHYINRLLENNNITIDDVDSGAFGLAGADVPSQKLKLTEVIEKIGFKKFAMDNDSFLGIKAGTTKGFGVCSVNGTGTVAGGIDKHGNRLQVGGIGDIVGDKAGGSYIARRAIDAVYGELYRCGAPTKMTKPVMELLKVDDKYYFVEAVSENLTTRKVPSLEFIQAVFDSADDNDEVATHILKDVALDLAKSTAGCINNLEFDNVVEVVLVGSVWVKASTPIMLDAYKEYMKKLTPNRCEFILLTVPPATGAVLWALELSKGLPVSPQIKQKIIKAVHI